MPEPFRVLTLVTLERKGACADQLALFRAEFGTSVLVTEALCVEHAAAFSWTWGAENLLSAPAKAAYRAATASAKAAYEAATASAKAAYEAATASAKAAYRAAQARAFACAYINAAN